MIFSVFPLVREILLAIILFPLIMSNASAGRQCPASPTGENQTLQRTLKLFEKDPSTWKIIPRGAKGVLSFNERTGRFTFTADKLRPLKEYSLVRHNEGANSGDLLAKGLTDQEGGLVLSGTWQLWRGKVWLVPSDQTAQSSGSLYLTAWRPKEILFEEKVLGVVYPCSNKK
jgi:hypothetical protein